MRVACYNRAEMVEYIQTTRKRSTVADLIHILFNILLASAVVALTIFFNTPWLAIALVLLSKWRVIAVRPRYWWANLLSSLPDLVMGLSVVLISWSASRSYNELVEGGNASMVPFNVVWLQCALAVLYAIWLIAIKPLRREKWVLFQASAAQFMGLTALSMTSNTLPLLLVVLGSFVVGFASARQMLGQYDEESRGLLASVWGLLVAILAYACWHWNVQYPVVPQILSIPQIAIIVTTISFVATRVYKAWANDKKVTWAELGAPTLFTAALTLVILLCFGGLF